MQRVFITGASSGIGAALALSYARRGAQVALVGRRADALEAVLAGLPALEDVPGEAGRGEGLDGTVRANTRGNAARTQKHGDAACAGDQAQGGSGGAGIRARPLQHCVYVADVRDRAALHAAAADFLARGPVDAVIACAGISVGTLTEALEDFDVLDAVLRTNVQGTVATFEPFIASMKQRRSGTLVGIASVAAVRGLPGAGAYSASKAALRAYCESLRVEMRGTGVKVVTIAPGFIRTPMTAGNPYRMPFLMPAERFAERAVLAIDRGASYRVIPWQMRIVAKFLRLVPDSLYDAVAAGRKRKPRQR